MGQAVIDRIPTAAAVRTFEHSAATGSCIERVGVGWVNRQREDSLIDQAVFNGVPVETTACALEHAGAIRSGIESVTTGWVYRQRNNVYPKQARVDWPPT